MQEFIWLYMEKKILSQYPLPTIIGLFEKCTASQLKAINSWLQYRIIELERDITEWNLDDIEITTRSKNILIRNGIEKVGQLLELESILYKDLELSNANKFVIGKLRSIIANLTIKSNKNQRFETIEMPLACRDLLMKLNINTVDEMIKLEPIILGDIGIRGVTPSIKTEFRQKISELKLKREQIKSDKRDSG